MKDSLDYLKVTIIRNTTLLCLIVGEAVLQEGGEVEGGSMLPLKYNKERTHNKRVVWWKGKLSLIGGCEQ